MYLAPSPYRTRCAYFDSPCLWQLTKSLVKHAPHKNKFGLDPAALGIVPRELPSGKELLEGSSLLQEEAEEWNPSGQGGLAAQVQAAQEEDDKNEVPSCCIVCFHHLP